MKQSLIKTAKTTDLAIEEALRDLGMSLDEVEIEIVEKEQTGFLGLIGQKDAVVKVTYEVEVPDIDLHEEEAETSAFKPVSEEQTIEEKSPEEDFESKEEAFEDLHSDQDKSDEEVEEDLEDDEEVLTKQESEIEKYYRAKDLLTEILNEMHFEEVKVIGNLEDDIIKLDAHIAEGDTGIAIGKNAGTLEAIEFIIRKAIGSRKGDLRVNIDINNYKKRRDDNIIRQADEAARRVQKTKRPWNLRYMNSYERRLAHTQISKYENLESHSEGSEPRRFVVVEYKFD